MNGMRLCCVLQMVCMISEEYLCHVTNRQGLVGIAVVDKEYPTRAAFSVIQKAGTILRCVWSYISILLW